MDFSISTALRDAKVERLGIDLRCGNMQKLRTTFLNFRYNFSVRVIPGCKPVMDQAGFEEKRCAKLW